MNGRCPMPQGATSVIIPPPQPNATANSTTGNTASPQLPEVEVTMDEADVADEVIGHLARAPGVYQRGGALVHVVHTARPLKGVTEDKDAPRIAVMENPTLRELITTVLALYIMVEAQKGVRVQQVLRPPRWLVNAIHARQQWQDIPVLDAVVEHPLLLSDGTILEDVGYSDHGLLHAPAEPFPPVPAQPSWDDAVVAMNELVAVVKDFPFKSDAHRAAWVAGVLTPLARFGFSGCTPMLLIDANVRGAGKTLLAELIGLIVTGRSLARMSQSSCAEEERKRITALVMDGCELVLMDNVAGSLGTPALDAALTSTRWQGRILGQSKMVNLPMRIFWIATGNNVLLAGDLVRRVLQIRLESPLERPEERDDFAEKNLVAWVRANRPRLLVAALTVLKAYVVAGRPDVALKPWGSFDAWSALIRGAIVWTGQPDPALTRQELVDVADRDMATLERVIIGWERLAPAGRPRTVTDVVDTAFGNANLHSDFVDVLEEIAGTRGGKIDKQRVGSYLSKNRDRVVDGRALQRATTRHKGGNRWQVATVQPTAGAATGPAPSAQPTTATHLGVVGPTGMQLDPQQQHLQHQLHRHQAPGAGGVAGPANAPALSAGGVAGVANWPAVSPAPSAGQDDRLSQQPSAHACGEVPI